MEGLSISEICLILNFLDIKTLGELKAKFMRGKMKRKRKEEVNEILPLEMIEEDNKFDLVRKPLFQLGRMI